MVLKYGSLPKEKEEKQAKSIFSLVNACVVAKYNFISFVQYCQYNLDYKL